MSDPCRKDPCFHGGSLLRALLLFIDFDLVSDVGAAAAFMLRLLHSSLFDRVCNPPLLRIVYSHSHDPHHYSIRRTVAHRLCGFPSTADLYTRGIFGSSSF